MKAHLMRVMILSFVIAIASQKSNEVQAQVNAIDSISLVALYNNTSGPGWINNSNWLTGPVSSWYGITLNVAGDRVTGISLVSNNLVGVLPISLGYLSEVTVMAMSNNSIFGSLPQEVGLMTSLEQLLLMNNDLSGSLPDELFDLPNLRNLYLNLNEFSGTIPASISNGTGLQFVDLGNNQFTGLSSAVTSLPLLQLFAVYQNDLDDIPDLSGMSSLTNLSVHNNNLTFDDIEPNIGITNFYYQSQDSIGTLVDTLVAAGSNVSFDRTVGGSANQYQWYRNGTMLQGQTNATLTLNSVGTSDAGTYHVEVTSPLAPDLTLFSRNITLNIGSPLTDLESDSLALVALYNATDGPNWTDNANWLTGPVNTWSGVQVQGGRVTNLGFNSNNLNGTLPSEIGNLTALQILSLQGDSGLTGTLPGEIGNMVSLTNLSLNYNQLLGNIPSSIYLLPNLTHISFFGNNLVGTISDSIALASNLELFDVSNNNITGSVPNTVTSLDNLFFFSAQNNDIEELPDMSGMPSLAVLLVIGNKLTFEDIEPHVGLSNFTYGLQDTIGNQVDTLVNAGANITIDRTVGGTANVYQWYKDGFAIPGETNATITLNSISAADAGTYRVEVTNTIAPELTLYSKPVNLSVIGGTSGREQDSLALVALYNATDGPNWTDNSNWLTGPLDTWYGIMLDASGTRVQTIQLTPNNLTGQIPPEVGQLSALWTFNLALNNLSGPIPPEIVGMQNVSNFFLSYNNLTEPIPNELWTLPNLSGVGLLGNNISGPISDSISLATNLFQLSLDRNSITSIPESITSLSSLRLLYLTDNELEDIPDMSGMPSIEWLTIHSNKLTFEDIQPNLGITNYNYDPQQNFGDIQDTTLAPGSTFTVNRSLPEINNQYQWFKDGIAVSGQNSSTLSLISFTNADIGVYYVEVTNPNVPNLTISSNPINVYSTNPPPTALELDSLALVALYNATDGANWTDNTNWLTGPLDTWYGITVNTFDNRVEQVRLSINNLNGTLPPEIGNLDNLRTFEAQANNLTGPIPPEVGQMQYLFNLYLSDNNLTGSIPPELGDIPYLGSIFLGSNDLSGTIPDEVFTDQLYQLILPYNNFSGEIPAAISNSTNLSYLDLGFNDLIGDVPNAILSLSFLETLYIGGNDFVSLPDVTTLPNLTNGIYVFFNRLTFEDIEPLQGIPNVLYFGQAKVGEPIDTLLEEGDSFSVDRTIGGSANQYQWLLNGLPVTGQNGPVLSLTNLTLADTGTYKLQVSNTIITDLIIESEDVIIRMDVQVDSCLGNYGIQTSGVTCASPFFTVPIVANNPVGNGIIGLNFCLSYDPAMVTPTGSATVGSVVTGGDASIADYFLNTSTPGQIEGLLFFNGNAPFPSYLSGNGSVINLEFEYDSGINPDDALVFQLCGVTESTLSSGDSTHCSESDYPFLVENESVFTGTLEFWSNGSRKLLYDTLNPAAYLPTNIWGTDSSCTPTATGSILPDLNGQFIYNTTMGDKITIDRDIPGSFSDTTGCTNMMSWINGTDQNRTMKIATNDLSFVPNIYQILAADVNRDGLINAADVTLIAARSVMNICGFTPDGIIDSEDWVFIDETTLNSDPKYQISSSYPIDDGLGYSRSNVPDVDHCLPVPTLTAGLCTETFDETYVGILLGDVNGNWRSSDGANARKQETQLLSFDFENMYEEDGYYYLGMVINPSEFEALDFYFTYDMEKLEIVDASVSESEYAVVHNVYQNQFLYSSYAMVPTEMFGSFMTYKIASSTPPTAEDFVQGFVYMDDEQMSIAENAIEIELPDEDWMIYPNPFDDLLYLQYFGGSGFLEIKLYNTSGKKVYGSGLVEADKISRTLELNYIQPGIYFLEIQGGEKRVVRKLIKQ